MSTRCGRTESMRSTACRFASDTSFVTSVFSASTAAAGGGLQSAALDVYALCLQRLGQQLDAGGGHHRLGVQQRHEAGHGAASLMRAAAR